MRSRARLRAAVAASLLTASLAIGVAPASAISGSHPVVVVLCNFSNWRT
jgi:hypothetical protein